MSRGQHGATLDASLRPVFDALVHDRPLDSRYRDHPLRGKWADHRDCRVKPDLVLIYRKPDAETLLLVRLGSHEELELRRPRAPVGGFDTHAAVETLTDKGRGVGPPHEQAGDS